MLFGISPCGGEAFATVIGPVGGAVRPIKAKPMTNTNTPSGIKNVFFFISSSFPLLLVI
jgi:hypothetical protein